jgi:diguanylate cyclase (GGDEF)-like protein/PAS domain S-box-containing protein
MFLATGVIVAWNEGAEALYGYTLVEAVGLHVDQLCAPGTHAAQAELRARALAGETLRAVAVTRRHRDGTEVEVVADLQPVAAGSIPASFDPPGEIHVGGLWSDMPGIVFTTDLEGTVTFCAGVGLARLGLRPGQTVGMHLRDFGPDIEAALSPDSRQGPSPYQGPFLMGGETWMVSSGPLHRDGERVGMIGLGLPGNHWWAQAGDLAREQARYRALAEHSSDLVGIIGPDGTVLYVSASVERLLGWHPEEVVGRPLVDFVHTPTAGSVAEMLGRLREGVDRAAADPAEGLTLNTRLLHANGTWRDYEVIATDYADNPSIGGFVVNGRDVTERRQADLRLRHASLHDTLTDLPNRALLIQEVESTLLHLADDQQGRLAVVIIGLDHFKLVNDSLGHEMGDHLLVAVARRLRRQVRASDTVARLGGDTFAVTTTGVADAADARGLASRLIAVVAEPYDLAGRRIAVTAGAGVALGGEGAHSEGEDGTTLVRNADTAMYAAKRLGRSRVELFEASLRADATRQLSLEQSLSRATAAGELRVHFQPIMALADHAGGTEAVSGVEALVRWEHPDLGLVPPYDFIPLSEETGHIVEIGSWVLNESCRTLMGWAGESGAAPLRLSVNLSPRQLLESDLPDVVAEVLVRTGFPVERLTMEVTESVLVDEGPYATTTLQRLRELGVRLSIDDFGTGYSSLVYLRRLNADALKIDRSFVDGLGRDSEADAIVNTVISLARSLGLDLVAEGVETEDQRRLLVELGCQFAQGYLFSRPLPADAFREWWAAGGWLELVTPPA